jgi:hypothetical protein
MVIVEPMKTTEYSLCSHYLEALIDCIYLSTEGSEVIHVCECSNNASGNELSKWASDSSAFIKAMLKNMKKKKYSFPFA